MVYRDSHDLDGYENSYNGSSDSSDSDSEASTSYSAPVSEEKGCLGQLKELIIFNLVIFVACPVSVWLLAMGFGCNLDFLTWLSRVLGGHLFC